MSAVMHLAEHARTDKTSRLVLADHWLEQGRRDVADLMLDRLLRDHGEGPKRMRRRVDKMTPAEAARMPEWAAKWIAIGLSTQLADRPLFEAAVAACYRHTGLSEPRVVWCPSPLVTVLAGSALLGASVHASVHDSVRASVRASVGDSVRASVRDSVGDSVRASVGDSVRASVRASVGDSMDASVHDSVGASVHDSVQWWRYMGGQFWVGGYYWWSPAAVSFALDVLRLDIGRAQELKARAHAATCMSACWWYPTTHCVFVSERPRRLEKWPNGKLRVVEWDGFRVEKTESGEFVR